MIPLRPTRAYRALTAAVLLLAATGCSRTPPPIAYGSQGCDYCLMQIVDPRFGGQLVTTTGKVHAFDSVECLAEFAASMDPARVRMLRVSDFARPGTMVRVEEARFYRDARRSGPMGGGWLAVSTAADSAWVAINVRGTPVTWDAVARLAAAEDLHPASPGMPEPIRAR